MNLSAIKILREIVRPVIIQAKSILALLGIWICTEIVILVRSPESMEEKVLYKKNSHEKDETLWMWEKSLLVSIQVFLWRNILYMVSQRMVITIYS